jgi:hypothetical protein
MQKCRIGLVLVLFAVVAGLPAQAVDWGIGLHAGTHGLGADVGVEIAKWFGVRAGGSFLDVSGDYEESGIDFEGDLALGGFGAFADVYPFGGGFRLSVGFLANRNEVDLDATPTEPQDIGGVIYDPSEIGTLNGSMTFEDTAPYFGIGWGRFTGGKKKIGFLADLGVLDQGAGDVALTATSPDVDQDDLDAEAAEIEEDIEDYDLWPVVSLGLAFRF